MVDYKIEVSIVIPFRNAAATLECCLSSISWCNANSIEIIAVNDGSTDESQSICQKFPCRVISLDKNYGQAYARNIGAQSAKGFYIIFMDADVEIINKDVVVYTIDFLKSHNDFVAIQGVYSFESSCRSFLSIYKHLYICYLQEKQPYGIGDFGGYFVCINKSVFFNCGQFNKALRASANEDTEFGLRLLTKGYKFFTDKKIKLRHKHVYSFKAFIKMEYYRSMNQAVILLTYIFQNNKTCVVHYIGYKSNNFYLSLVIVFLWWGVFFILPQKTLVGILLFFSFFIVNLDFICFIRRQRGYGLAFFSCLFLFFDLSICLVGAINGLINFVFKHERI